MPKREKPKYILAMGLAIEKCGYSDGYEVSGRVFFIDPAQRNDDCHLGKVTGHGLVGAIPEAWRQLENFRFHAWLRDDGTAYGQGPSWEAGAYCSLDDVRRMTKATARIDKALSRIRTDRGYPVDVADEYGRVASAIGCAVSVEYMTKVRQDRSGYRYHVYDTIGEAVNVLRHRIQDLKEAHAAGHPAT